MLQGLSRLGVGITGPVDGTYRHKNHFFWKQNDLNHPPPWWHVPAVNLQGCNFFGFEKLQGSKVVSTHRTGTHPEQPLPTGHGCFRKYGPPNHPIFNRVFHHKPSILGYGNTHIKRQIFFSGCNPPLRMRAASFRHVAKKGETKPLSP